MESAVPDEILPSSYLQLLKVQIIHRHGPRTPLSYRLPNLYPFALPLCSSIPKNNGFDVIFNGDEKFLAKSSAISRSSFEFRPEQRCCLSGELTDHGKTVMTSLGKYFHNIYHARLNVVSPENVYLRSTNLNRTIDSLGCVLRGFFPDDSTLSQKVRIAVRDEYFEDMYGSTQCAKYKKLLDDYAEVFYRNSDQEADKLKKSLPKLFAQTNLYGKKPTIYGVYDTLAFRKAHNLSMPEGVNPTIYRSLEEFSAKEMFGIFYRFPETIKFGIGRFLREIHSNLFRDDRRLCIYSGHDSTIAPLLSALFSSENTSEPEAMFPPFGSYLAIEQYVGEGTTDRGYVRVIFNGRPLFMPACSANGMHLEGRKDICTLEAFAQAVRRHIPENYLEECKL